MYTLSCVSDFPHIQDLFLINNALSGSKREGSSSKRNLLSSLMPGPQDASFPPAKRFAVPSIGLSTMPEKTNGTLGDFIGSIPPSVHAAPLAHHIPFIPRIPLSQVSLSTQVSPGRTTGSLGISNSQLQPPSSSALFDLTLPSSLPPVSSTVVLRNLPSVTTHQ